VVVACFKVGGTGDKNETSQVTQSRAGNRTKDLHNTKQFLSSGVRWYNSQLEMSRLGCEICVLLNCDFFMRSPLCCGTDNAHPSRGVLGQMARFSFH
jgi:hypothetical protein